MQQEQIPNNNKSKKENIVELNAELLLTMMQKKLINTKQIKN